MKYIVSKLTWDHLGNLRFDERSSEAIPIEWIKTWIETKYNAVYNNNVWDMLEDWEKENEID